MPQVVMKMTGNKYLFISYDKIFFLNDIIWIFPLFLHSDDEDGNRNSPGDEDAHDNPPGMTAANFDPDVSGKFYVIFLWKKDNVCTVDILFSSNHNIHKSSCSLCFWASDPLIDRFY